MHLQRNAYQNYILLLTNNFKFYILQILGHLDFLSVFFRFAKNQFESLNNNVAHAVCRWQAHCVNNSERSTQGVKGNYPLLLDCRICHCKRSEAIYKVWIASAINILAMTI